MTMQIRIHLGGADQQRFGVHGLALDLEALKDLEYEAYQAIEIDMKMPIALFLPVLEAGSLELAQVKRVAVFLALRQADNAIAWDDCTPRPGRTELEREADPAGPPAGPSEHSSEDAVPASS
jgi:hypothetical protein